MLTSWRLWLLALLFLGPYFIFIGFGFLWLMGKGWLIATTASLIWIGSGGLLYILGARWTKSTRAILPPIDWNSPSTFAPVDREAWTLVLDEAEKAEAVPMESLIGVDLYINTGRALADRLAKHYHPMADDAIEKVPVIEVLTALELAAEDLNGLVRQVPGGDLITPEHWKAAVQAAGYIQKANNIYSYLLPLFNPITGLPRLASQHLMVKPAWKSMQQNLLRWFFQAYVNRLGMHLIELYSGRLIIGSDRYRRLRRKLDGVVPSLTDEVRPLAIAVAGSRVSDHGRVVEAVKTIKGGDPLAMAKFKGAGLAPEVLARLMGADWTEVPGYTAKRDQESARDRATRRDAVAGATDVDMVLLLIDDRHGTLAADAAFAADWDRWFIEHPRFERPPLIVAVATADGSRVDAARAVLPPTATEVVALDPGLTHPIDLAIAMLRASEVQLPRAERVSVIRHLSNLSNRSKAGRLVRQVGQQGKLLLQNLRRPKPPADKPEATTKV